MKHKIFLYTSACLLLIFAINNKASSQVNKNSTTKGDSIYVTNSKGDTLFVRPSKDLKEHAPNSKEGLRNKYSFTEERTDRLFSSLFGTSKQLSNADSIIKVLDALPPFGIYKDNYFATGTELFSTPTQWNSDGRFQISVRHRLTNSTLPFKTYMFFTYTQKAFWDIYKESFPFRDLNYNPTLGIGKALVYKNRLLGAIGMQFEHESNGKDGIDSRSWNKLTFTSTFLLHNRWMLESEIWIPIVDGGENKDIVYYSGFANMSIEYTSSNKKYILAGSITKRGGWNLNHNVTMSASARIFGDSNQFLFIKYYNGYGESMLDYKQYRQRLRVGFVIKPNFMNFF